MSHEQTNEVLRNLLLRLESVQREVGEVQSELIRLLRVEQRQPSAPSGTPIVEEVDEPEEELAPPRQSLPRR